MGSGKNIIRARQQDVCRAFDIMSIRKRQSEKGRAVASLRSTILPAFFPTTSSTLYQVKPPMKIGDEYWPGNIGPRQRQKGEKEVHLDPNQVVMRLRPLAQRLRDEAHAV